MPFSVEVQMKSEPCYMCEQPSRPHKPDCMFYNESDFQMVELSQEIQSKKRSLAILQDACLTREDINTRKERVRRIIRSAESELEYLDTLLSTIIASNPPNKR